MNTLDGQKFRQAVSRVHVLQIVPINRRICHELDAAQVFTEKSHCLPARTGALMKSSVKGASREALSAGILQSDFKGFSASRYIRLGADRDWLGDAIFRHCDLRLLNRSFVRSGAAHPPLQYCRHRLVQVVYAD
jgi:hypothetical protein